MATTIQVKKLANPRRVKVNRRRAGPKRKRRAMSVKQIRIFGTKRQKAALKSKRKRRNPAKKVAVNRRLRPGVHRRRRKSSNPAPLIITLGAMNPRRKKRSNPVAKAKVNRRRRRRNPTVARRRRSNPRRVVVRNRRRYSTRRRRRNPSRVVVVARPNRRRHSRRRRNPINTSLFGHPLFGRNSIELIGGGFIGLVAAKFIPTLFPASLTSSVSGSSIGKVVISGVSAVLGGWAGSKVSPQLGQGILFGGMIQTASVALNAFLPTTYAMFNPQLGDLMPGQFAVPQNPLRLPAPPPAMLPAGGQARVTMNGLARAYGSAW